MAGSGSPGPADSGSGSSSWRAAATRDRWICSVNQLAMVAVTVPSTAIPAIIRPAATSLPSVVTG